MKLLSGYKFYNYAKKKYIVLNISKCCRCGSTANGVVLFGVFGPAKIYCEKCGLSTGTFYTDTNYDESFAIEKAIDTWNNHKELYDGEIEWMESEQYDKHKVV